MANANRCNDCDVEVIKGAAAGGTLGATVGGVIVAATDIACGGMITVTTTVIGMLVGAEAAERSSACCSTDAKRASC